RLQQFLRSRHARVVLDQRLFMSQADCDLLNPGKPAQRFFNSAGAQRTVQPSDTCANSPATRYLRRFFAPEMCRRLNGGCVTQNQTSLKQRDKDSDVVDADEYESAAAYDSYRPPP